MSPTMRVSPSSSRVARRRPLTTTYMARRHCRLHERGFHRQPALSSGWRGEVFPHTGFEAAEFLVENFAQEGGLAVRMARAWTGGRFLRISCATLGRSSRRTREAGAGRSFREPPEPDEPVIEAWLDGPFSDYDNEPGFAEN
jgi:hypothetical protein